MKTIDEIYQQLMERYQERSGFALEDSCDLSVRLYAAAAELQALSIQADWVLAQSFPQTASGQYLDYHAELRGLSRTAASRAVGILRFSVFAESAMDLTVEKGTVCMTADETRFETTETVVLPAGELYVDASAIAVTPGAAGNVLSGLVTSLTACPVGITACTNPSAFSGGADAEDDESLRERILESYQRLPNGANAAFYEETAMSHQGVTSAVAVGRPRGIGTVDVYITAMAGAPTAELLAEVEEDLQAHREIAVDVQVKAPDETTVDVSAEVEVKSGADFSSVQAEAESAIRNWFTGKLLGKRVRLSELGELLYHIEDVENYHILSPMEDLAASPSTLPVLGSLSITEVP